LMSICYKIYLL